MSSLKASLITGLALLASAVALTLRASPMSVAGASSPGQAAEPIAATQRGASYCQADEAVPGGTSAIRVWLDAAAGPRVAIVVSGQGRQVTSGERASNWTGGSVTIPVRPPRQLVADATVCVSFQLHDETVIAQGAPAPAKLAAHTGSHALPGRIHIEYLRPGSRSWASLAPTIAQRMGFGRGFSGAWVGPLAVALLAGIIVLASRRLLRDLP